MSKSASHPPCPTPPVPSFAAYLPPGAVHHHLGLLPVVFWFDTACKPQPKPTAAHPSPCKPLLPTIPTHPTCPTHHTYPPTHHNWRTHLHLHPPPHPTHHPQALSGITSLLDSIDSLSTTTGAQIRRQISDATQPLDSAAQQVRGNDSNNLRVSIMMMMMS